ncbi:hypothetical protein RFI_18174, partial [Reticulomyxa filosa]
KKKKKKKKKKDMNNTDVEGEAILENLQDIYEEFRKAEEEEKQNDNDKDNDNDSDTGKDKKKKNKNKMHTDGRLLKYAMEKVTQMATAAKEKKKKKQWPMSTLSLLGDHDDNDKSDNNDNDNDNDDGDGDDDDREGDDEDDDGNDDSKLNILTNNHVINEKQLYRKANEKPLRDEVYGRLCNEFMDLDESSTGRLDFPEFFEGVKIFYHQCTEQECRYVFDMFVEMQQKDTVAESDELDEMQAMAEMLQQMNQFHSAPASTSSSPQFTFSQPLTSDLNGHRKSNKKRKTISIITELQLQPFLKRIQNYAVDMNSVEDVIQYIFQKMVPIAEQTRV